MIIVNLKGGIGNQLFQYALGKHLALKNSDELKLDIYGLDRANKVGDIYRPFALDAFNITRAIATPEEVHALKYPYGIVSKGWRYFAFKVLKRTHIVFEPSVLSWRGDIYLDGYWQSPRYFDAIRDTLLTELTIKEPSESFLKHKAKIESVEAVSIHVRRGDYVKNPRVLKEFGICTAGYYTRAIEHVSSKVQNPVFFVFSDDIAWVKENLPLPDSSIFIEDKSLRDVDELALMNACKHNIIANSSFSWWAAWLNRNENKVVVAPTPWFKEQPYDTALIPNSWTQLQKS